VSCPLYLSEIFLDQAVNPDEMVAIALIAERLNERTGGQVVVSEDCLRVTVRSFAPLLNDLVVDQVVHDAVPGRNYRVEAPKVLCGQAA